MIDGTGKTIIPGLVDLHVHYMGEPAEVRRQFAAQLAFGVTTARSIGADPDDKLAAIEDVRSHKIPGPRLYTAGRGFTHPDGNPLARRPATSRAFPVTPPGIGVSYKGGSDELSVRSASTLDSLLSSLRRSSLPSDTRGTHQCGY